jgi:hypothetical protein
MNLEHNSGRKSRRWLPKSIFGRVLFGIGGLALIVLAAGAFVAFSVWVENRFPKQDSKHPVLAAARRVVTRPVVNALSHGAEAYVRKRAEAPFMYSWLSLDETIARFLDQRVPIEERRLYAYRLARDGSPKAVEALLKVFQSAFAGKARSVNSDLSAHGQIMTFFWLHLAGITEVA